MYAHIESNSYDAISFQNEYTHIRYAKSVRVTHSIQNIEVGSQILETSSVPREEPFFQGDFISLK